MKKREIPQKKVKKVFFLADDHTYWLDKEGVLENNPIPQKAGVITQIPSVGKFYGKFFPAFESDYWLTNGALKALIPEKLAEKRDGRIKPPAEEVFPELLSMVDPGDFFAERHKLEEFWAFKRQNSAFLGTKFHTMMENEAKANGYIVNPWNGEVFDLIQWEKKFDNEAYPGELADLPAGGYSELLVYDLDLNVAGQIDMCFVKRVGKRKLAWVGDFKGLDIDTPIATKDGWKKMGDLVVGDIVFDGDGNLTTVKVVSDLHHNPCYKIKFDSNDLIVCDHEHRWVVDVRKRGHGKYKEMELTTEELLKLKSEGCLLRIPCTKSIKCNEKNLPIDPYVLGVWLGDGNSYCGTITNETDNVWAEIEKRGYSIGENLNSRSGKAITKTVYGLEHHLRKLGLLKNKHIPDMYLRSSTDQRLDLLRGFMDADGSFNVVRRRCVMRTTQKWQAESLSTLVSSLGYKPIIMEVTVKGFGLVKQGYDVAFSPDESPFLARNCDYVSKRKSIKKRWRTVSKNRYIKSIELTETVPTKCIAVDSHTHTYLAGKNLIKTHNTNEKKPDRSGMESGLGPLSHLQDCKHNRYAVQLSMYAYILEKAGFEIQEIGYSFYKNYDKNAVEHIETPFLREECENIFAY